MRAESISTVSHSRAGTPQQVQATFSAIMQCSRIHVDQLADAHLLYKSSSSNIRRPRPAARGMAPGKRMLPPLAATTITTTTTTRTTRRRTTTTTTTTTATTTIAATLHYTTIHEFNCSTLQLQMQMQIQLQLHYFTLQYTRLHYTIPRYGTQHYSTLQYTTLITPHDNYNCNCNYTTLVTLHYNYNLQVQLHYTTTSSH